MYALISSPSRIRPTTRWSLVIADHLLGQCAPVTPAGENQQEGARTSKGPEPCSVCWDPARKLFMIIIFDEDERKLMTVKDATTTFDINGREQLCIAIAAMVFSPTWARLLSPRWPHTRCWTDNHTAMARTNSLGSNSRFAQQLTRCIDLAEARYRFRISAAHLPGIYNVLADAGSRQNDISYRKVFTNGVSGWTQVPVPSSLRYIYKDFSAIFKPRHWPGVPESRTSGRGVNGAHGEPAEASNPNCHDLGHYIQRTSSYLPWNAGPDPSALSPIPPPPCCLRLATFHGIISDGMAIQSSLSRTTSSLCEGCKGCRQHLAENLRLHQPSSGPSVTVSHLTNRTTVSFGGGVTVMVFFFLLRRSEYLAVGGKFSEFAIQRRDVMFADGKGNATASKQASQSVTLRIRGSKTDQLRESTRRTQHRSETTRAGYDSKDFGTHSLRSGGATALYTGGSSDTMVKLHGRWKRECYQRYIHIDKSSTSKLANTMLNSEWHTPESGGGALAYRRRARSLHFD
ncbi:Integrase-like, catalytic domain [Phytophthora cactorum]|nr:Integrase-like, catalytic domain [Phytophthora cactorum]